VFFSFWVLLGSSGVPSGVLLVFFWCSSGVLLVFDNTEEHQKNPEEPSRSAQKEKNTSPPSRGNSRGHFRRKIYRIFFTQKKKVFPSNSIQTGLYLYLDLDLLLENRIYSSQHEKQNFAKIRTQFIADCSQAVKQGVKSVLLGQKPIAFAGAALSAPQTSTVAAPAHARKIRGGA